MYQAPLSFTISWSLLTFMSIELVMLSTSLILCCPLLLSIFPSIRVFSNESALCIFGQSIGVSPSKESALCNTLAKVLECHHQSLQCIFRKSLRVWEIFKTDWFDLPDVQQFESINSLALSLLYGPLLTSIHDCWKKP